jgi:dGTP triphosphohydrolase
MDIPQELQKALSDFFPIYEFAEESFKKAQQILNEVNGLNEFRYCARNLVGFLKIAASQQANVEALREAIYRATHAARNAVNDSLDLTVDHAAEKLGQLRSIDKEKELSYYVHNLDDVENAIGELNDKIAISRRDLTQRIEIYRQICDSPEFETLIAFANPQNIGRIMERIAIDQHHMVRDKRRFWLTIVIGLLGIVGFSNLAKFFG